MSIYLNKTREGIKVENNYFENLYGYDGIKKELMMLAKWFGDEEILNNDKVTLPKAVLLVGSAGCGKTLILREYSKLFNCKKFIIDGSRDKISEEISNAFAQARNEKSAVIIIDELELLVKDARLVQRTLQQELDGINNKGNILVLAATNNITELSPALLRPGRFDRKIEINLPDQKSRVEILKGFVKELGCDDKDICFENAAKICFRTSCAELKSIVNDAYLRCGNNITTHEIQKSYERIVRGDYCFDMDEYKNERVAIHEAGHVLMTLISKNFKFYRAGFSPEGGFTETVDIDERVDCFGKREDRILISLSGCLSEVLLLGDKDIGSFNDYVNAKSYAERLVERSCVYGIKYLIPRYFNNTNRYESIYRRREVELKVDKLLRKLERKTKRILKRNKQNIKEIANMLLENGKVYNEDLEHIKNNIK